MARTDLPPAGSAALPYPAEDPGSATLALFDLDRTLLPGSSLVALGRALARARLVPTRLLVGAGARDMLYRRRGSTDAQAERLRNRALAAVAGVERASLLEALWVLAERLAGQITPGARLLVERHLSGGDFCVVLSASPQELVELVCARLGAHRGIGTRGEIVDGCFTGRLDGPFCYGPGKLDRLAAALGPVDLSRAWAYADSASDLPLLRAVGHPVAVNPDRRLRAVAVAAGWPVLGVA